jgi:hypothetical protein
MMMYIVYFVFILVELDLYISFANIHSTYLSFLIDFFICN